MSRRGRLVHSGVQRAALCVLLLSELTSGLRHYHFFTEPKTWSDARSYCRRMYRDLAYVGNAEDVQRLIAAADSGYQGDAWIGLNDRPLQWVWSTPFYNRYIDPPRELRLWAYLQPNNKRWDTMLCVYLSNDHWYDANCSAPHNFVCHRYPHRYDYPIYSHMYIYVNQAKTWLAARDHCRQYFTDLAYVRSHEENKMIQEVIPAGVSAFIGLHRHPWQTWSDGKPLTFKHWADGHPLGKTWNCAASVINADQRGHWVEKSCSSERPFMCYSDQTRVYRFAVKSTGDLKGDSVLRENFIKEIEARLKEKGFTRDVRLTWV